MTSLLMNKMPRILKYSIRVSFWRVRKRFKVSLHQNLQLRFRRAMEGQDWKLMMQLGELYRPILAWWVLIWIRVLSKLWDRWGQLKKQRLMLIRINNIKMLIKKMMLKMINAFRNKKMQKVVNKILILMQCFSLVQMCLRMTLMAINRWLPTLKITNLGISIILIWLKEEE